MQLNNTELAPNFTIVSNPDNLGEANSEYFIWRRITGRRFYASLQFQEALFFALTKLARSIEAYSPDDLDEELGYRIRHMKTVYGWLCYKASLGEVKKRKASSWVEEFLARSDQYWLSMHKACPSHYADSAFLWLFQEAKSVFSPGVAPVQPAPRPTSELQPA